MPFVYAVLGGILVNACLGVIWRQLVVAQGQSLSLRDSIGLSWRVQIAKYIPGNVFHFAGRILLAERMGIPRGVATWATLLEPILMVIVAGLISLRWVAELTQLEGLLPGLIVGVVLGGGWVLKKCWWDRSEDNAQTLRFNGWGLLIIVGTIIVFFGLLALMFSQFLPVVGDAAGRSFGAVGEMVTFSWAVGFVAIGAPGGLGVREAALILFAQNPTDADALLLIGVLTRAAMLVGDAVSMLLGMVLLKKNA